MNKTSIAATTEIQASELLRFLRVSEVSVRLDDKNVDVTNSIGGPHEFPSVFIYELGSLPSLSTIEACEKHRHRALERGPQQLRSSTSAQKRVSAMVVPRTGPIDATVRYLEKNYDASVGHIAAMNPRDVADLFYPGTVFPGADKVFPHGTMPIQWAENLVKSCKLKIGTSDPLEPADANSRGRVYRSDTTEPAAGKMALELIATSLPPPGHVGFMPGEATSYALGSFRFPNGIPDELKGDGLRKSLSQEARRLLQSGPEDLTRASSFTRMSTMDRFNTEVLPLLWVFIQMKLFQLTSRTFSLKSIRETARTKQPDQLRE